MESVLKWRRELAALAVLVIMSATIYFLLPREQYVTVHNGNDNNGNEQQPIPTVIEVESAANRHVRLRLFEQHSKQRDFDDLLSEKHSKLKTFAENPRSKSLDDDLEFQQMTQHIDRLRSELESLQDEIDKFIQLNLTSTNQSPTSNQNQMVRRRE
jgi:hypothetical protein